MSDASHPASRRASRTTDAPRLARIFMQVLWPAFLVAIVAEGIFFSMIDPQELRVVARYLQDSREAAYTLAFFVFWALFASASGITYFLSHGSRRPVEDPENAA